jgi:hypothetical protein
LQAIDDLMPGLPPRGELRAAKANGFFQNVDEVCAAPPPQTCRNSTLLKYSHARNTASSSSSLFDGVYTEALHTHHDL